MKSKNYSISLIRMLAFLSIFLCHIMKYLDLELEHWFNVGVQIFLFMSGYLYGPKTIENSVDFYIKEFKKILVPYYVVIFPVIILHIIYVKDLTGLDIILTLLLGKTIYGGGHLWFVPYILMCYIITPLLDSICRKIDESGKFIYVKLISVIGIFSLFYLLFSSYFNFIFVNCFILGFFFGRFKDRIKPLKYAIYFVTSFNLIQIYIDYISALDLSKNPYYQQFCNLNHVFLSITIFFVLLKLFNGIQFTKLSKNICDFSDKYTYTAYLVHQFLILGSLSLMEMTPYIALNAFIIFIITILLSVIAKYISDAILQSNLLRKLN